MSAAGSRSKRRSFSLGALRKLRFPINGENNVQPDDAARTVLAAIGLCAGVLASERGTSLRSRCGLHPTAPRVWELLDKPGDDGPSYSIDGQNAIQLLRDAIEAAKENGTDMDGGKVDPHALSGTGGLGSSQSGGDGCGS